MSFSPNLALPFIGVGQESKEITHNQAILQLDILTMGRILDRDLTVPPVSPTNGQAYIVANGATGDWAGQDENIAYWFDDVGLWKFIVPKTGWKIWVVDESLYYRYNSSLIWEIDSSIITAPAELAYTATGVDTAGLTLNIDAAGYAGTNSQITNYDTGAGGQTMVVKRININAEDMTAGNVFALSVSSTAIGGGGEVYAIGVGAGVNPVHQLSGVLTNTTFAEVQGVDELTDLSNPATSTVVFVADNDTLEFASPTMFDEAEFTISTPASGAGIDMLFEYSTGVGTYSTYATPSDGTNQFRQTGPIIFGRANLAGWAVGASGDYEIRITRQRNALTTTPILDHIQVAAITEYDWDEDGNVIVNSLTLGTSTLVSSIFDEDNMASDSATGLATQQSIKAYVDSAIGLNNELSEVLANGNITDGTSIIVSAGDDLTLNEGKLTITNTVNEPAFTINSSSESSFSTVINADFLTTGTALFVDSDSPSVSSRNLFYVRNDNALATGTTVVRIQNDSTGLALSVGGDSAFTGNIDLNNAQNIRFKTGGGTYVTALTVDAGDDVRIGSTSYDDFFIDVGSLADAVRITQISGNVTFKGALLTNGDILRSVNTSSTVFSGGTASNSGANGVFYGPTHATLANDWKIRSGATNIVAYDDSASALDFTNASVSITLSTNSSALLLDQNGNGVSLSIDSEATSAHVISIGSPQTTTGNVIHIPNADSLTTGKMLYMLSNSANTSTRILHHIFNQNSASVNTTLLHLQQNSANQVMILDQNTDSSFIDFQGTAGASVTNPISTHPTAGAQYGWGQVEVNGAKKWVKFYEDPSA